MLSKSNINNRKVLGIDVGTAIVGWEVMSYMNNKYVHIDGGVITTDSKSDMNLRLNQIYTQLTEIIEKHQPNEMAVEELFYFKNNKTVISVSEARGVILLAGERSNLSISEYTPLQVKMAVTGYGRAEKNQVQFMVKRIMNFNFEPKPDDWADAIAIAICHLNSSNYNNVRKTNR